MEYNGFLAAENWRPQLGCWSWGDNKVSWQPDDGGGPLVVLIIVIPSIFLVLVQIGTDRSV
jgi:hypothetical protein